MASVRGPLSPHLTIYRWQVTMLVSIGHRVTGVFLSLGLLLLCYWLLAVASGPEAYAAASAHLDAWYGQLVLAAFAFSLYFHLLNGVRHLFWDVLIGLEKEQYFLTGYGVILGAVLLTLATWIAGGAL